MAVVLLIDEAVLFIFPFGSTHFLMRKDGVDAVLSSASNTLNTHRYYPTKHGRMYPKVGWALVVGSENFLAFYPPGFSGYYVYYCSLGCDFAQPKVREVAEQLQLPNCSRKDSQGICFLGKVQFREFVKVRDTLHQQTRTMCLRGQANMRWYSPLVRYALNWNHFIWLSVLLR